VNSGEVALSWRDPERSRFSGKGWDLASIGTLVGSATAPSQCGLLLEVARTSAAGGQECRKPRSFVILSGAGSARSALPAESKDLCTPGPVHRLTGEFPPRFQALNRESSSTRLWPFRKLQGSFDCASRFAFANRLTPLRMTMRRDFSDGQQNLRPTRPLPASPTARQCPAWSSSAVRPRAPRLQSSPPRASAPDAPASSLK
jgi:hypothetical protein